MREQINSKVRITAKDIIPTIISIIALLFSFYAYYNSYYEDISVFTRKYNGSYYTNTHLVYNTVKVYWELIISNNSDRNISIIDHDLTQLTENGLGSNFNGLDQGFYNDDFKQISLPLDIEPGKSKRIYLAIGTWLSSESARVIENAFSETADSILIDSVAKTLARNGIDMLGNKINADGICSGVLSPSMSMIYHDREYKLTLTTSKNKKIDVIINWYTD